MARKLRLKFWQWAHNQAEALWPCGIGFIIIVSYRCYRLHRCLNL